MDINMYQIMINWKKGDKVRNKKNGKVGKIYDHSYSNAASHIPDRLIIDYYELELIFENPNDLEKVKL